jgi:hypothetical protein
MSFIQLKKDFISYVIENKWIDDNNKELINLPPKLMKKLGIKNDKHIKFGDIDRVMNLFYD